MLRVGVPNVAFPGSFVFEVFPRARELARFVIHGRVAIAEHHAVFGYCVKRVVNEYRQSPSHPFPSHKTDRTLHHMEPLLWRCVVALAPFIRPDGVVMDAGANDGSSAMLLSDLFSKHTVLGIEPVRRNYERLKQLASPRKNVIARYGGLGSQPSWGTYPDALDRGSAGVLTQTGTLPAYQWQHGTQHARRRFPIFTVDALLHGGERLAFAHWDVEGSELSVILGARTVLLRDRPMFTVETFPRTRSRQHSQLMQAIDRLAYTCRMISESCGVPDDCRNSVCSPKESTVNVSALCG